MSNIDILRATARDSAALSALAFRSKAHWGYDARFMDACRVELTVTPARIAAEEVWKAIDDSGAMCGFYALAAGDDDTGEVMDVFVAPESIGRGVGRALMAHLIGRARELGYRAIFVDADPNAEHFYRRMGFAPCGRSPSGSIPGRWLPRLCAKVAPESR